MCDSKCWCTELNTLFSITTKLILNKIFTSISDFLNFQTFCIHFTSFLHKSYVSYRTFCVCNFQPSKNTHRN